MRTATLVMIVFAVAFNATAGSLPPRRSFEIATGPAAGTYFSAGEAIARIISHPPGLARCEKSPLCGAPGVIVSARSSDGAVATVLAVNAGRVASGFAPGFVVAAAQDGRGVFSASGRQGHIRVMADLFTETVQLVVPRGSPIKSVAGLKGRRVSVGAVGSDAESIGSAILKAYRVRPAKLVHENDAASGGLMREGTIDAFFVLGAAPSALIADMVSRGQARLVPIDGAGRTKLLASMKGLSAGVIAAGAYQGAGRIETVASRAYWITADRAVPGEVYELVRALYQSGNRPLLDQAAGETGPIRNASAEGLMLMPLHPGAARYYREAGILK